MIDYTIHACIEHYELKGLIYYLKEFLQDDDNIIVVLDENNTNDQIINMVQTSDVKFALHPLMNFTETVKFIRSLCTNETILALCADEIPTIPLLQQCRTIFTQHPTLDAVGIPRINIYSDLTEESAKQMYTGFRDQDFLLKEPKNQFGWHCWPDYQIRLTRNVDRIKYSDKIHGGTVGYKNVEYLPAKPELSLLHVKSVAHQERILKLYDKMGTKV